MQWRPWQAQFLQWISTQPREGIINLYGGPHGKTFLSHHHGRNDTVFLPDKDDVFVDTETLKEWRGKRVVWISTFPVESNRFGGDIPIVYYDIDTTNV